MDLEQHLDRLGALLDKERAAEKERFAQLPFVERVRRGLDGAKVRGHQRAIPSFGRAREPRLGEHGGPSTSSTLLELRSSIFAIFLSLAVHPHHLHRTQIFFGSIAPSSS